MLHQLEEAEFVVPLELKVSLVEEGVLEVLVALNLELKEELSLQEVRVVLMLQEEVVAVEAHLQVEVVEEELQPLQR